MSKLSKMKRKFEHDARSLSIVAGEQYVFFVLIYKFIFDNS